MPTDIRIIRAHEFIQATPEGKLDLEKTKAVLMEIALASKASGDFDVILDTRNTQSEMDVADLWELAAELHRYREAFSRKTAVLGPADRSEYAGFFSLCAQERGFNVRAFVSFGDAMEWLDEACGHP
jgi:hypothetical protein